MPAGRWEPDDSVVPFTPRKGDGPRTDHFVEFYDDEDTLADSVTRFVSIGLAAGEAAVVIAEPTHLRAVEERLGKGVDLDSARADGQYLAVDAEEALGRFMVDGAPDGIRFDRFLNDAIAPLKAGGRPLRFFGEMVAVLWAEGNVTGALALEDLWNRFLESTPGRLFCAYPTHLVGELSDPRASAVCDLHSHILVPNEGQ